MTKNDYTGFEIAVVGMACKFPGANDIHQFWDNLKNGVESISTFSDEELREYKISEKDLSNPSYIKTKGLIKDAEFFDASFFGFSHKEANILDPQFRVLSQCAYHALEDAGYNFGNTNNRVGVFLGAIPSVNWQMHCFQNTGNQYSEQFSSLLLNDKDFMSTRLSYLLNLHGPSNTVYTACSTSLVSVDMACQSLLTGKSDLSLAGGVALSLPYKSGYTHEQGMIMSKDGHTSSFDANATGTIWSDGVGTVVLKRLEDAIKDGDNIHAVIKGTATNNDGNRKVGYTAPSVKGQVEVIKESLSMAEIASESISYVEGHGSATALGDKIEISALSEVFKDVHKEYKCPIGSVKSNVGHLNTAAGIAGFIKVCLMLKHSQIPPSINFNSSNSKLKEPNCSFFVNEKLSSWKNDKYPLRAGVSSFGIGGTNAHVILEKAIDRKTSNLDDRDAIVCLSAKTPSALDRLSENLSAFISQNNELDIDSLAYTLQTGREHFQYRKSIVAKDIDTLVQDLSHKNKTKPINDNPPIVMMFPGMGAIYPNLGKDLYRKENVFKEALDDCFQTLKVKTRKNFKSILFPKDKSKWSNDFLTIQLLVFSYEYALTKLLNSWGVKADYTIGYSLGEYIAACISGVFSMETAFELLIERSRLISTIENGGMIGVPLSAKAIQPYLVEGVSIGVDNGQSVVIAGNNEGLNELRKKLNKESISIIELDVAYAVHSPEMNPVKEQFKQILSKYTFNTASIPLVTNMTGTWSDEKIASPDYWVRHLSETVFFSKGLNTLLENHPDAIFLQVGAGNFLGTLLSQMSGSKQSLKLINLAKHEKAEISGHHHLLNSIATFWEYGGAVNWKAYHDHQNKQKLSIPTYPFEERSYDLKLNNSVQNQLQTSDLSKNNDISSWFYAPSWKKAPLIINRNELEKINRNILVFGWNETESLSNILDDNVDTRIIVKYSDHFKEVNEKEYFLNYNDKNDLLKLFQSIEEHDLNIDTIIDFTSLDDKMEIGNKSLKRTIDLFQVILQTGFSTDRLEYIAVTNNLFSIYGNEKIDPSKSTILSAIKIIPQENLNISCRLIEIDYNNGKHKIEWFYQQILRELNADTKDKVVSYRSSYRWAQTMEPYPLYLQESNESHIKKNGTYIITGGLGDIGFTITKYLLKTFKANVILVGRTQIPDKSKWKGWLKKHGSKDAVSQRISKLLQLEKLEGKVSVMQADSAIYIQMENVFAEVKSEYGNINGVFHAAGHIDKDSFNLINSIDKQQLNYYFPTKVDGLSILNQLVKKDPVDFVVVISSFTSILGGLGMIGYAAANQYVDSMMNRENINDDSTKWMTFNFSYWKVENVDFEERTLLQLSELNEDIGNTFITTEEGGEVFEKLLSKNNEESQIIISPVHLPSLIEKIQNINNEYYEEENDHAETHGSRPLLPSAYVAPNTSSEQKLVKIWEELFGVEPIGIQDDFLQLGGDSLSMIMLISKIHKAFGVLIDIQDAFKNTNFSYQLKLIETSDGNDFNHIEPASINTYYPQSDAQKRLFILNQMNPEAISYNVPMILKVEGDLDVELCENVFKNLINRHETLRTSFHVSNGEAVQEIHDSIDFDLQKFNAKKENFDEVIKKYITPFDLSKPPLFRIWVSKENDHLSYIIIDIHHIIMDGASLEIMIRDFMALYNRKQLDPLRIQYKDYAVWQQSTERENHLEKQKEFWLNEFENTPNVLNLPTDFPRPLIKDFIGSSISFELEGDVRDKLKEICKEQEVTMSTLLLTIYYVLVSKITNQDDIVIGISTMGRQHLDLEKIIGVFINTLAIRNYPSSDQSFKEFLNRIKNHVLQCFENQEYSFERLVDQLKLKPDTSRNPLFDITYEYLNFAWPEDEESSLRFSQVEYSNIISKFDLSLHVTEKEDKHIFQLDYQTDLFKKETIERFVSYFKSIINAVAQSIDFNLFELNFLPVSEQKLLTDTFNATVVPYERDESLVTLFERQVKLYPDIIAVNYEDESLTYKELNDRSNQVAHYLVSKGVMPGNIVGLLFGRSLDMIVGIFGVLKAGGAYLPLDPNLPEQRIGYMLDQSRSTLLLSTNTYLEQYSAYLPVQAIDSANIKKESTSNLSIELQSDDLAYCIFTSGSSGKPKGVMMNQRSVINLVKGLEKRVYHSYKNKKIRVALLASFSFDASIQQIFGCLLQGHSLYVVDEESRKDGAKLRSFYNTNAIDLSDGTPTHLRVFVNALNKKASLDSLSSWILAGEVLSKELVEKFHNLIGEKVQLYNFYGPTETCVDSTCYKVDWDVLDEYDSIPIGKPLPNERVYVTDSSGSLLPIGVIGELCIAGDGLAQRYVGNGTLTLEKFNSDWIAWEDRVYRTGDLVRWLSDGNLAYHGRIDNQVKIRGHRIELSGITHQLNAHPEINHSITIIRENEGEKDLIAYYESSVEQNVANLRSHLEQLLPSYMIPSHYVHMTELPRTINGKVDRNLLPDFELQQEDDYVAPSNEAEQKLVEVWSGVLNVERDIIGVNSNFFDLGGNSLNLVFLRNKLTEIFKVSLSLKKLIVLKDIRELAMLIASSVQEEYSKIPVAENKGYYPLSSSQKRLYFLNEFDKDAKAYNQPQSFILKGILDREKLTKVFQKMIARHESLRTSFEVLEGEPIQRITEETSFELEYFRSTLKGSAEIISNFVCPFDLEKAPLLRVGLIRISKEKHIMMLDIHHIISDGISIGIFINDFMALYREEELLPLRLHYKDYAVWQQNEEQQKNVDSHKQYWNELFSDMPSVLELPTDYVRPKVISYHGNTIEFTINSKQTKGLNALAKASGSTLFSVVLGIYKVLLSKLTGQEDLIVGTSVAGRNHSDIENVMGVFLNSLPLRNTIENKDSFHDLLLKINKNSLLSFEHQDYPYEALIGDLSLVRDTGRNPLFDVMFEYANFEQPKAVFPDFELLPYSYEYNISKFDLTLHANETQDGMQMDFQYSTDLFRHSTVENFVKYFKRIVDQVISNIDIRLNTINLLSKKELKTIESFNGSDLPFEITDDIVKLFETRVSEYPSRTAIVYKEASLSYKELNERSNQVAVYLVEQNIKKGDIVGLVLNRSLDIIVGILGVLKSGAAYLPIEPKLPLERTSYILKSGSAKLLLGHKEHLDRYSTILKVHDIETSRDDNYSKENLVIERSPSDLAYCIYTSGSTGVPKGVLMEHSSIVNLVGGLSRTVYADLKSGLNVGLLASYSFDASCQQIFGALLEGHSLFISSEEERMDGLDLYNFYKDNTIEVSDGTPTHFGMLLSSFSGAIDLQHLKRWLLAGETLSKGLVRDFYDRLDVDNDVKLYNLYGPTESCVDSTYYCIDPLHLDNHMTIPIGRPLPNERIYIVDSLGHPVPQGIVGELCLAGAGLARGYVDKNNEKERFVTDWIAGEERVYRTGDLACWLPDGNLEYRRRIDSQVKLRGYRIELGEIEHALLSHHAVVESAVVLTTIEDETYLSAYYVSEEDLDSEILREYLINTLPEYMIPSFYVRLDNMPLTTNGKLNREALPSPDMLGTKNYIAPSTETEQKLVEIWSEVLKLDPETISIEQSFLAIGGHSLKAIQIANKIKKDFSIEIKLVEIFQRATIVEQAKFIDANQWLNEDEEILETNKQEINI